MNDLAALFAQTILEAVEGFAEDTSIPVEARLAAIKDIGTRVFGYAGRLEFKPPTKVGRLWKLRDRSLDETPFEHARREYPQFIREGGLKTDFMIDPELYAAMRKKYWIDKEIARHGRKYIDTNFLTKPESNRRAIAAISGLFQDGSRPHLPQPWLEQLRLLDLGKRHARGKKRSQAPTNKN